MYRNRAEATSPFQIVPAGEPQSPAADGGETLPLAPQAEAPLQPLPVKAAPAPSPVRKAPPRRSRRRVVFGAVALLAIGVAGYFGYEYWTVGRFTVSTDDAYVQAYNTTLAAKVPGYLASVPVTDNTVVHAGDVIATIDDGDYKLAVDAAREKVTTQQATIARMGHQIQAQEAAVAQAKTQLVSAQAAHTRTQLELDRQIALVARDASSRQLLEQAQANRDQAVAGVQGAQAAIESAAANVDVLKGQQQEAISTLDELKTALAKAERDLSFTVIRAPIDGVIGNRAMQTGDFVQTGQRVASLVPLDDVFVNANFKETQLARLHPGQTVSIAVDALPEHAIEGTIESFSPASGAVFSLLPPDNATGNFTKIVQRLPVRIHVPPAVAREGLLRPGMSVVVSVNTKVNKAADAAQSAAR
ncbi:MAG TPA: HlyD family secretion protein [Xanthobacteraceae bacterium]|jgi:membrane fusion protein (multidrug efflux system)